MIVARGGPSTNKKRKTMQIAGGKKRRGHAKNISNTSTRDGKTAPSGGKETRRLSSKKKKNNRKKKKKPPLKKGKGNQTKDKEKEDEKNSKGWGGGGDSARESPASRRKMKGPLSLGGKKEEQ